MAEAIAVEGMSRLFFQSLLLGRDIPPTRHLCPELSMTSAFLDVFTFCFCPPAFSIVVSCRGDKAMSLESGEFYSSSPWLSLHFLEAGTTVEKKASAQGTQPYT